MDEACLRTSLQGLMFGGEFDQIMDNVSLPNGLLHSTFGNDFDQRREDAGAS